MSAQQVKEEGNALVRAGKFKKAIAKYQAAIEMDPEEPAFQSNLAHCYFKLKRWPEQEAAARQCLAIDATFIKGYYRLATALKMQNKYDEAIEVLNKSLEVDPGNLELKLLFYEVQSLFKINGCANCGEMKATKACSICTTTYYCNKVCQREHWPVHQMQCISSADAVACTCASCLKQIASTDLVYCDKCGVERYCSTTCRDQSRAAHQPKCWGEELRTMDKISKLFLKYFDSPCCRPAYSLATHAMTRQQFMDPDPQFVICVTFQFHPNYASFVPTSPPVTLNVNELPESDVAELKSEKQKFKHLIPEHHFRHILMIISELPNGGKTDAYFVQVQYNPSDYQSMSYKETLGHFRRLGPSEKLNAAWRPIRDERFKAQLQCVTGPANARSANWIEFLLHAFRFADKNPLFRSHVVLVHFEAGYGLGQIDKLTSYEMMTIKKACKKKHCSQENIDRAFGREQEGCMLAVAIFASDPFRLVVPYNLSVEPAEANHRLSAAEWDKAATDIFQETPTTFKFPLVDPFPNIDDFDT